jgi:hypothetical protein
MTSLVDKDLISVFGKGFVNACDRYLMRVVAEK